MYLLINYTGPASRINYGNKGDKVEHLKDYNGLSLVRNSKGVLFYVLPCDLSNNKI